MSREALKRVDFLGKPPTSRNDFHWILQIAGRLTERPERKCRLCPANVIPFPGMPAARRESSWK